MLPSINICKKFTDVKIFILVRCFFLLSLILLNSAESFGHEASGVNSEQKVWLEKFYIQFLKYHSTIPTDDEKASRIEPSIKVWNTKLPLNNEFYKLMQLSLNSVAHEYNEFCDTCLVNKVKEKAKHHGWVQMIENKLNEITEFRATIQGIKREYGYMAIVGYIMMEMLEHTFLGPLGVCPILNAIYFSSLDVFKSMLHVLKYSRDFRFLGIPSIAQAIQAGMRIFLFKMRATKILYEFDPQMRKVSEKPGVSQKVLDHLNRQFRSWWFWKNVNPISEVTITNKAYNKLSRQQERKKWLYWQTELQSLFSRRLLWPIAYEEIILNPGLFGEDAKVQLDKTQHQSFDWQKELKIIYSVTENPFRRLSSAISMHDYFYIIKKMMLHLLSEDLHEGRISRQQYLESYKDVMLIVTLLSEFSNYNLTASLQKKNSIKLERAFVRSQHSLNGILDLVPILESWFEAPKSSDHKERWEKVQSRIKIWYDAHLVGHPWRKPKITLWGRAKSCSSVFTNQISSLIPL
jgi:hypothetical protein